MRLTGRAGWNQGFSDPVIPSGRVIASTIKGTPGIKQADLLQEFTSTRGFATSMSAHHILGCSRSQGSAVRRLKWYRELGSERRETVRSLSAVVVRDLRRFAPSTERTGVNGPLVCGLFPRSIVSSTFGTDNR